MTAEVVYFGVDLSGEEDEIMAVHAYHEGLPTYHPDQIFIDGCPECERRGKDVYLALDHMDRPTFARAWARAQAMRESHLPSASFAEMILLHALGSVHAHLNDIGRAD